MELWLIYAIISIFLWGFYNFWLKMIAERKYDTALASCYDHFFGSLIAGAFLLYSLQDNSIGLNEFLWTAAFALLNVLFFSLSILSRVESMRHIDTVIFFPLYKTFGPILVTMVSLFYFWESLTIKEIVGILIGISVPLMLITKTENKIQKNLLLWVGLVVVTSLLTTVSSWAVKQAMENNFSVPLFVFLSFVFGIVIMFTKYYSHSRHSIEKYETKWIVKFSAFLWFIHVLAFFSFTAALDWNLAIVFTINSFSILVPIILSIWLYGEHFNLRKWIVIALSIASITLFI